MTYPDRYHLTPEQSRFLAKKKWDENVYCGMKMENRAVTFPQTKTILEGVNVPGVQLDDIQAILNMRDAWRFLMGSIDEPVTLEYLCKLNEFIARNEALERGKLRTGSVAISGTDYTPPVPQEAAVRAELATIPCRRYFGHRKGAECLLLGHTRAAVLGWQQAYQPDAGKQDPAAGRSGRPDHSGSKHGAVQRSAAELLQHRRSRAAESVPVRERNTGVGAPFIKNP